MNIGNEISERISSPPDQLFEPLNEGNEFTFGVQRIFISVKYAPNALHSSKEEFRRFCYQPATVSELMYHYRTPEMLIVDPESYFFASFERKNAELHLQLCVLSNGKAFQSTGDKTTHCASVQLCSSRSVASLARVSRTVTSGIDCTNICWFS